MKDEQAQSKRLPSAFDLFKPSIAALKLNAKTFAVLLLIPIGVGILSSVKETSFNNSVKEGNVDSLMLFGIAGLIIFALSLVIMPAVAYAELASARGEKVDLEQSLKAGMHFVWRYLGLSILVGLVVMCGFLLLIVPGIFMIRRYLLAPYYLIDGDLKIMEAFRKSGRESAKLSGPLWGLLGVEVLLGVPSAIPVVGAYISAVFRVVYLCAPAVRYFEYKKLHLLNDAPVKS